MDSPAAIRALLLAFFYRQIPLLIERGHVYIAQPPLLEVKRGKNEMYVKDDNELNAILNNAVDFSALCVNEGAPPLLGAASRCSRGSTWKLQAIIKRWSKRWDAGCSSSSFMCRACPRTHSIPLTGTTGPPCSSAR